MRDRRRGSQKPAPPGPIEAHPPGDDDRVTPIGARRTSVADLQREVERLTEALELAETRRQTAERTLADVASMAAADTADLRVRLAELQERLDGAAAHRPDAACARLRRLLLLAGPLSVMALLVDGILTIVGQEPITALQQSRDQGVLRTHLQELQQTLAAAPKVARETSASRIRRQALTLLRAKRPHGSALGSFHIPRIGLKTVFVESTDHQALKPVPATTAARSCPGSLYGTVGLAGHRTTYGVALPPRRRVVGRLAHHPADALRPVHLQGDRHAHHHTGRRLVARLTRRHPPPRADRLPPAVQRREADRPPLPAPAACLPPSAPAAAPVRLPPSPPPRLHPAKPFPISDFLSLENRLPPASTTPRPSAAPPPVVLGQAGRPLPVGRDDRVPPHVGRPLAARPLLRCDEAGRHVGPRSTSASSNQ